VNDWPRRSWMEAEPERLAKEREVMAELAPEMVWVDDAPAGGWEGLVPAWPFERPEPEGLAELLDGRQLRLRVEYRQAFPSAEPRLVPLDPDPPIKRRVLESWHLMGDGSLCLLRTADLWTGRETAADLVVKASGWFIEYLLMEQEAIERMTVDGIYEDDSLDDLIRELAQ
jgi:hypothetical protein